MKLSIVFLLVVCCAVAMAYPRQPLRRRVSQLRATARLRRAPLAAAARQRTMLISGYYRPLFANRRQGYEPETAMSAFAAGDNVAAGSYLGTQLGANCATCGEENTELLAEPQPPLEDAGYEPAPELPLAPEPEAPYSEPAADAEVAPLSPNRTPKKKPIKKAPKEEEVSDEEEDEVAVAPVKGRRPANSYFPIVFSGYPGGARSGSAAGGSGGVTAIANSYSTGKGGVATSHATAYGSGAQPRGRKRGQPAEDDDEE